MSLEGYIPENSPREERGVFKKLIEDLHSGIKESIREIDYYKNENKDLEDRIIDANHKINESENDINDSENQIKEYEEQIKYSENQIKEYEEIINSINSETIRFENVFPLQSNQQKEEKGISEEDKERLKEILERANMEGVIGSETSEEDKERLKEILERANREGVIDVADNRLSQRIKILRDVINKEKNNINNHEYNISQLKSLINGFNTYVKELDAYIDDLNQHIVNNNTEIKNREISIEKNKNYIHGIELDLQLQEEKRKELENQLESMLEHKDKTSTNTSTPENKITPVIPESPEIPQDSSLAKIPTPEPLTVQTPTPEPPTPVPSQESVPLNAQTPTQEKTNSTILQSLIDEDKIDDDKNIGQKTRVTIPEELSNKNESVGFDAIKKAYLNSYDRLHKANRDKSWLSTLSLDKRKIDYNNLNDEEFKNARRAYDEAIADKVKGLSPEDKLRLINEYSQNLQKDFTNKEDEIYSGRASRALNKIKNFFSKVPKTLKYSLLAAGAGLSFAGGGGVAVGLYALKVGGGILAAKTAGWFIDRKYEKKSTLKTDLNTSQENLKNKEMDKVMEVIRSMEEAHRKEAENQKKKGRAKTAAVITIGGGSLLIAGHHFYDLYSTPPDSLDIPLDSSNIPPVSPDSLDVPPDAITGIEEGQVPESNPSEYTIKEGEHAWGTARKFIGQIIDGREFTETDFWDAWTESQVEVQGGEKGNIHRLDLLHEGDKIGVEFGEDGKARFTFEDDLDDQAGFRPVPSQEAVQLNAQLQEAEQLNVQPNNETIPPYRSDLETSTAPNNLPIENNEGRSILDNLPSPETVSEIQQRFILDRQELLNEQADLARAFNPSALSLTTVKMQLLDIQNNLLNVQNSGYIDPLQLQRQSLSMLVNELQTFKEALSTSPSSPESAGLLQRLNVSTLEEARLKVELMERSVIGLSQMDARGELIFAPKN
jgi:hypothetical protein